MALLLAAELLGSLQVYDYRKCIPYISIGSGITRAEFETRDDHSRWQIDTSLTFRGKRCKTLNPDMLFSIFGRYSGDEPKVVRALMIKWIKENREAFDKATFIGMIAKDLDLDNWLINMESTRTVGDEFALYALCRLFSRHARVITRGNTWHTVSVEGTFGDKFVEEACDVHLLFIARDTIAELKKRTTGAHPQLETPTPTQMLTKPLGLKNMELPDVSVPKLPDETGDYVTTLGKVIPLPSSDLEIPPNLLQNDIEIIDQDNPTPRPDVMEPPSVVKTYPCSIRVRKLDDTDIAKWLPKPNVPVVLPDGTAGTSKNELDLKHNNYNLRKFENKVQETPLVNRPQRSVNKPGTYAEPTDESSQDSQIIGTVYTLKSLDSRPAPDESVEKIVGLSEPSAYRLRAQHYIEAKRHGELPLPPVQTLPGFKSKKSDNKVEEEPADEESADSEATVLYTPPEIPDATDNPTPKKGKLRIKKLSLRKSVPQKRTRMFKCAKCVFVFSSILELNDHFLAKHRKLKCDNCEKSFEKPRSYAKHKYQHKQSKHTCDICGKGFAFSSRLAAHRPVHGIRSHVCDQAKCNKSFTHASDLKKHQKTHTKKWWRCPVAGCSYKNRDERNLKSHSISHSTTKGFKCKYCGKTFQWSMQLVRHYNRNICVKVKRSDSPMF